MEFSESMFVVGVIFNNSFIIRNLYELLPIVPYTGYTFVQGGKTLPYFGTDNAIVSIVPKIATKGDIITKIRGIRQTGDESENSSQGFGNSVGIDFQTFNKNYYIKLYSSKKIKSKFHITGLTSFESSKIVTSRLLEQIELTELAWIPFFQLSFDDRVNMMMMIYNVVIDNGVILPLDNIKVVNFLTTLPDKFKIYRSVIDLILRFTLEDSTYFDFGNRLFRICKLSVGQYSIFHNECIFQINMFDIYLGNYIGHVGYTQLYFRTIAEELSKLGFKLGYTNIGKPEIRIMIPSITEEHFNNGTKTKTIEGHLFIVKLGGTVSLSSKANVQECLSMGRMVIQTIRSIVESSGYVRALSGNVSYYDNQHQNYNNQISIQPQVQNQMYSTQVVTNYISPMDSILSELESESYI